MVGRAPAKSCFEKAVDLLGRRAHFRRELELKLQRRGYENGEIAETLQRLQELKYLDDERTAGAFVEQRAERSPAGKPLLKSELVRRGVTRTLAEEATEGLDEAAAAKEAADRFLRRRLRPKETKEERQQALFRHLAGRGFQSSVIRRAMTAAFQEIELAEEAFEALESSPPLEELMEES